MFFTFSTPEAPPTLLGCGNLALFICVMSFQKFLKSLLHSFEASLSALRISAFFSQSFVAFKMSASNFHYIIQGTNLLCFLEEITKWVDDGSPVDVVHLDFQKAFDKVPHQRLLLKIKAHGIGNDVINWIEKWLTHRRQRVIVDGEISNWKSVLSGVPQGSVLGPILFLIYIYINDLEDDISSKVLKFADDTKVFRKVTNNTDKQSLQDDLDKLVKWSEKWQMLFNFGKCKCIHIGHGNMDEEYKMGGAVLGRTTQ